jgi:hypothetical protein
MARSLLGEQGMNPRLSTLGFLILCAACGGQSSSGQTGIPSGGAGTDTQTTTETTINGTTGGSETGAATAGSAGSAALPPTCTPGRSVACACTSGQSGAQVCESNGTYGACQCDATTGAGGSPPMPVTACPCTRRPGDGNSIRCPIGVGETASGTIGKAGGKITLTGRQTSQTGVPFSLEIPPTALDADTMITVTETTTPPPADFVDYSPVYSIEPAGLSSTIPLPIVIGAANNEMLVTNALAIYGGPSVSGPFKRLADSYVNAGFMQGSTKTLGAFFVGYPKRPEQAACP